MFLSTMKPKALAKLAQHPGLFDREKLLRGARPATPSTTSSPRRCTASATPTTTGRAARPSRTCTRSAIPALVVNAVNDPFVPAASLPRQGEVGSHVTLWQPAHGGHVGFPLGAPPGHVRGMPERVAMAWLNERPLTAPTRTAQNRRHG